MSSGGLDLFLLGAGNFAASNQRSISGSCVVGCVAFFLFPLSATSSFISCTPCVPLKWEEGSKRTDSMRYTRFGSIMLSCLVGCSGKFQDLCFCGFHGCRVGFGVKYFGFQHINLCFVLFIFLRGVLTWQRKPNDSPFFACVFLFIFPFCFVFRSWFRFEVEEDNDCTSAYAREATT